MLLLLIVVVHCACGLVHVAVASLIVVGGAIEASTEELAEDAAAARRLGLGRLLLLSVLQIAGDVRAAASV
jgi:hypothetical protein